MKKSLLSAIMFVNGFILLGAAWSAIASQALGLSSEVPVLLWLVIGVLLVAWGIHVDQKRKAGIAEANQALQEAHAALRKERGE